MKKSPSKKTSKAASKKTSKASEKHTFPVVGIGASAGGLDAYTQLLKNLPNDTGMAYVLIQHLDPDHDSSLTEILGRTTKLPVTEVTKEQAVKPNHIYVISPNTSLIIKKGRLQIKARPKSSTPHKPVDIFFESLAADQSDRAIGVVLSGTGNDGTQGLEAIKAEGGITFAHDESARYDSMPRSAVNSGCVDKVLSPRDIAKALGLIGGHPYIKGDAPQLKGSLDLEAPNDNGDDTAEQQAKNSSASAQSDAPLPPGHKGETRKDPRSSTKSKSKSSTKSKKKSPADDDDKTTQDYYKKILLLLRHHSGVDFSLYKSNTIQRRINRRVVLSKKGDLHDYIGFLRGNQAELDALYTDVLISVTSFFRNPEVFDTLKKDVFPKLIKNRDKNPIRIWVLGCSTGQEAYSLAMALQETADKLSTFRKFQIFATDLNESLLDKARRGLYAKSLSDEISAQRLSRFFIEEQGGYRVNKALRESVIFAQQNLITDPPFSRMDLISCRNLMIYLEPSLQQKAVPTFHYALKQDGYLLLGASESISHFTHLFEPLTKKHKIFLRKAALSPTAHLPVRQGFDQRESAPALAVPQDATTRDANRDDAPPGFHSELNALREADRVIINRFSPPGVLISNDLEIMQFRGETSAYLKPPVGKAHFSILKMAREGLLLPLRAAINEAKKTNKTAYKDHIKLKQSGEIVSVNLEVIPLKNLRERCFLIVFHEMLDINDKGQYLAATAAKFNAGKSLSADEEASRIAELEVELSETVDYLQSMQQQHEAANEELQAASEEAQSANEELQSINEELETSKEELESANEELTTVNEEMGNRNTELNRLNNDLHNIQTSASQAIILMNRDLTVRRFSKEAETKFGLLATDVERPISHVRHNLVLVTKDDKTKKDKEKPLPLEKICAEVISTVREQQVEVRDAQDNWYSLRFHPYMTHDNKVDGVVVVMVDITLLKENEQIILDERDFADNMIDTLRQPLLMLDKDLCVVRANAAYYRDFSTNVKKTIGESIFDLGHRQWDIPRLRELLEKILPTSISINDFQLEFDNGQFGQRTLMINARRVQNVHERSRYILLAIEDITDREAAVAALRISERRYREMINSMPVAIYTTDAEGNLDHFNKAAAKLVGYTPDPLTAPKWGICWKIYTLEGEELAHEESPFARAVRENRALQHVEYIVEQPSGERIWCAVYPSPIRDEDGRVIGGINILLDITEQKQMEHQLEAQATALSGSNRRKDEFMAMLSHELRNPLAAIVNALQLVREGKLNEMQDEAFGVITRQSQHMTRLISDLLEMSRINTGRITLQVDEVDIDDVIRAAVERAQPLIQANKQTITLDMCQETLYLQGDAARLEQVFGNLLNNASKYTDPGGHIELSCEQDDAGHIVIHVTDNGSGIAPDFLPHIFDLFTQAKDKLDHSSSSSSSSSSSGGLGIGLSLVRSLVELHGGSVTVNSDTKGSDFVVKLPQYQSNGERPMISSNTMSKEPETDTATASQTALRILVVDDNRDATRMSTMLLQSWGHEVQAASDGPSALDCAQDFHPQLILLDIGLPGMNGYETAQQLRKNKDFKNTYIVAVTGYGTKKDRQLAEEAGFDAHLVKPVEREDLKEVLDTVTQRNGGD